MQEVPGHHSRATRNMEQSGYTRGTARWTISDGFQGATRGGAQGVWATRGPMIQERTKSAPRIRITAGGDGTGVPAIVGPWCKVKAGIRRSRALVSPFTGDKPFSVFDGELFIFQKSRRLEGVVLGEMDMSIRDTYKTSMELRERC